MDGGLEKKMVFFISFIHFLLYVYSLAHCPAQCTMYIYYLIDFPSRSNSDAHALKEVRDLLKNDLNKENMEKAVCFLINIKNIWDQRPNLKNLNRGLNLSWFSLKLYSMFQDLSLALK